MRLPNAPVQYDKNDQDQTRRLVSTADGQNQKIGASELVVNGPVFILPGASVAPGKKGQVVIELTNNTTLTFHAMGSDGTVRSATLTLS